MFWGKIRYVQVVFGSKNAILSRFWAKTCYFRGFWGLKRFFRLFYKKNDFFSYFQPFSGLFWPFPAIFGHFHNIFAKPACSRSRHCISFPRPGRTIRETRTIIPFNEFIDQRPRGLLINLFLLRIFIENKVKREFVLFMSCSSSSFLQWCAWYPFPPTIR